MRIKILAASSGQSKGNVRGNIFWGDIRPVNSNIPNKERSAHMETVGTKEDKKTFRSILNILNDNTTKKYRSNKRRISSVDKKAVDLVNDKNEMIINPK